MVIYVSPNNPGANRVAQMLKRSQPKLGITQLPPPYGKTPDATGIDIDHDGATIMLLYLNGETPLTTLILYPPYHTPHASLTPPYTPYTPLHLLTHPSPCLHPAAPRCTGKTFLGEAGAKLGKELLAAKRAGFPILMLHENDPAKHGCEFSIFFDGRTPSDLMQEGIYSALALALYPGEFQATSVALAALALGATEAGPWARLNARILDKCNERKGSFDAHQVHIVEAGQGAQALSRRSLASRRRKPAAAEPSTLELPTAPEIAPEIAPEMHGARWLRVGASSWPARQAQRSTPPDDLANLADRSVLLEGKAHWKAESAFYKPAKVQLLAARGHDGAPDADAGAPPWSIIVVNGEAVPYEEVTAVKVDEKILEFMVEHTRKYSSRSERLHRQHLRMHTRSEFCQWRDALRPEMIKPRGGSVTSTSAGHTPKGESAASASAGYHPGAKRASSTLTTPANSVR